MRRIYLDNNATTPIDPRVSAAMRVAVESLCGNPSSVHWFGQQARGALEDARGQVGALIAANASEIVFTSGGTEADNTALRGVAATAPLERRKLLVSAIEHHAVLHCARALAAEGWQVEHIRAQPDGCIDLEDLETRLDERTALVCLMLANNETGVIQPVAEATRLAKQAGALVHCDAVQAAGRVPIDVTALGVDLLALSAHKIYGPPGIGALYVKRGTRMKPLVAGGSQEKNRRAGTENVPGIVAFGQAAELAREALPEEPARMARLRDELETALLAVPGTRRNGDGRRVANTTNLSFAGIDAESLLMAVDLMGIAVSTGAACAAGAIEPSHVLRAMGLPLQTVRASVRFSVGRFTASEEIVLAAAGVMEAVERQRQRGVVTAR